MDEHQMTDAPNQTDESGYTFPEFIGAFVIFMLFSLFVFQFGLAWHAKQITELAAEEAVDAASNRELTEAEGYAIADQVVTSAGHLENITISVTDDGELVTARVEGDAYRLVPFGEWRVVGIAQAPKETFVNQADR